MSGADWLWPRAALTAATRSRPSSMPAAPRGCCASRWASQASRVSGMGSLGAARYAWTLLDRRNPLQQRDQGGQPVAHLAPIDDHVDGALVEQEFGPLESLGQRLAHRLLDDTGTGKADQRTGLGNDDVADKGEAGGNAAHGRIGQEGQEGQPALGEERHRSRRLGHLQQREETLLHAGAAAGGDAEEGKFLLDRGAHTANEALADDRAHRTAHEIELEAGDDDRYGPDRTLHDDQGVVLLDIGLGRRQAIQIALAVLELERIDRQHLGTDLEAPLAVEQQVEADSRPEAVMMAALRTDALVVFQIGAVEYRLAGRALAPESFGDGLADSLGALDLGRQQLLQPAHEASPPSSIAARIPLRNAATRPGAWPSGEFSISSMMRLPMTTASATAAIRRAALASRMPNPTPTGMPTLARIAGIRRATSAKSRWVAPVTPFRET